MDLFSPPTDEEIIWRKADRQRKCKHEYDPSYSFKSLPYVNIFKQKVVQDLRCCIHCQFTERKIRTDTKIPDILEDWTPTDIIPRSTTKKLYVS